MKYIQRLSIASVSPIIAFALRFVRTIIMSHMLSPDNLGGAIALMTILTGCDMITDVGLDRFVIVNSGENRAQAVAVAQQIMLGRSFLIGIAIAIFSPQLANLFGASEHLKGIAWLGLVPIIYGFRNLRLIQIQQDYRYTPEAIVTILSQVCAVGSIFPAALWFKDERAILVSLLVESVINVSLSNIIIKREKVKYIDVGMRKAVFRWGMPLVLNGIGLMIVKQMDQIIVANLFDLKTLAIYVIGLNLAITPTSILHEIAQKLSFPFLGKATSESKAAQIVLIANYFAAAAYALPVGLLLDKVIPLLYGYQYQASQGFCALAMFDAFLRFSRGGPNIIMLHFGQTKRLTVGNFVAGIGIVISLGLGMWSMCLEGVMIGLVIGDFISLIVLILLLQKHFSVSKVIFHTLTLASLFFLVTILIWTTDLSWMQRLIIFSGGNMIIFIEAFCSLYNFKERKFIWYTVVDI